MNGFEAMAALEKGKKVRDVNWPEGHYWQYKKAFVGGIIGHSPGKTTHPEYEVNDLFNRKWEIYKEYVTFEEAMKAFKEGYTVNAWDDEGGCYELSESDNFSDWEEQYPVTGLGKLIWMKWTIEDEGENK